MMVCMAWYALVNVSSAKRQDNSTYPRHVVDTELSGSIEGACCSVYFTTSGNPLRAVSLHCGVFFLVMVILI